jgi:hypothetical protein
MKMPQPHEQVGTMPGLAWLGSYPRSGAALVRTILAHAFGHVTASAYNEEPLGDAYAHELNALRYPATDTQVGAVLKAQKMLTVKTHEPASKLNRAPSIVIFRDGRRVLGSLRDFYRDRLSYWTPMELMIRGDHLWKDWSGWIRDWKDNAEHALWLRYEDVMRDTKAAIDVIAEWMDIKPVSYIIPPFSRLHLVQKTIFRKADMAGNGGMEPHEEELFWELHGDTMRELGYECDSGSG